MSFSSNVVKKIFKTYQSKVGDSYKSIIKTIHTPQSFIPPYSVRNKNIVSCDWINGLQYLTVQPRGKIAPKKVLIYIHGGAYILQISMVHWLHIDKIVNATNSIAYVPIYPLTSENYSSQMDTNAFLLNLYKEVAHKHPNDEINIMGDSAGGNFALILAQEIKKHGLKKPKNVILLSPVLDFVINESAYKAFKKEEIFTKKFLLTCQSMQLCKNNPKNPLFSPIYGNCKDIGMIHLFVATNEVFYSSVIEFSKLLQKNKIRHTIEVRDNVFHDYPIFLFLKEAIETNKTICKIIKSKTK